MTKTRPSVTGQGPEIFGRGIDLLFGGADEIPQAQPTDLTEQKAPEANKEPISGLAQPGVAFAKPLQTQSEPPASAEPLPLELGGTAPIPLELGGTAPIPLELGGTAPIPLELGGTAPIPFCLLYTSRCV